MSRRVLTDVVWKQLQIVMRAKGCHRWANDRDVTEDILWKLRTGALPSAICPGICARRRPPIIASIVGLPKDCGQIFFELRGEVDSEWVFIDGTYVRAHQHASGARTGKERAIGKSRKVSESLADGLLPSSMLPPMRMEIRSILKSLGVKFTTRRLRAKSSAKSPQRNTSSRTRITTPKRSESKSSLEE